MEFLPGEPAIARAVEGAGLGAGVQRAVGRTDGEREDGPPGRRDIDPAGAAVVATPHAVLAQAGVDAVAVGRVDREALGAAADERHAHRPGAVPIVEAGDAITAGCVEAGHRR